MTGKVYVLEGPECSGKTTLLENIKKSELNLVTKYEVARYLSEEFPELYEEKETTEHMYITANILSTKEVVDYIKRGYDVVMDRSWPCQPVYAKARKKLYDDYKFDVEKIYQFEDVVYRMFPEFFENMKIIYLDISNEEVMKRLNNGNNKHRADVNKKWLDITKDLYMDRLKEMEEMGATVEHIDANKEEDLIFEQFKKVVTDS